MNLLRCHRRHSFTWLLLSALLLGTTTAAGTAAGTAAAGTAAAGTEAPFYLDRHGAEVRFERLAVAPQMALQAVRYRNGSRLYVTGKLALELKPSVSPKRGRRLLARLGLTVLRTYDHDPRFFITAKVAEPFAAAREVFASGLAQWAEPVLERPIALQLEEPNDLVYGVGVQVHFQEALHGFHTAWGITTGARAVRVAVIDTGVDWSHPELAAKFDGGYDVFDPSGKGDPSESFGDDYHGTAVAGLIAAQTNNSIGIAGVCWSCGLVGVRFIDAAGTAYVDDSIVYDAFHAALEKGAWIINNSWGPTGKDEDGNCQETPFSEVVAKGVREAETTGRGGRGTLVVWAAGNYACSTDLTPHLAAPENVVVSALDGLGQFQTSYSNYGGAIDVAALEGNFSTDIVGKRGASDGSDPFLAKFDGLVAADYLRNFRGTSAAAPIVSGALALALSVNPNLTAAELRECLTKSAKHTDADCPYGDYSAEGHSPCFGAGALDAGKLVQLAASGECGGQCSSDDDCPAGFVCDLATKLCAIQAGDGGETDTDSQPPGTDNSGGTGSDSAADFGDAGLDANDENAGSSSCGCNTVGV